MSDPRLTLIRDGVAAAELEGLVEASSYRATIAMHCAVPATAIRNAPEPMAEQADQLVFGEAFDVLLEDGAFAFGQARRDGYVGYVTKAALELGHLDPTHWVKALRTYVFAKPDVKTPPVLLLTMNSLVTVEEREGKFARIAQGGWVFEGHLSEIGAYLDDVAGVAELFLGAPYHWGGRESAGVDCSGLIQQGLYACGRAGPRDTDMQLAALGTPVDGGSLQRNDLVFWERHVGIMLDESRLLHANSHHMATGIELLAEALDRIKAMGFAPTAYRRL